MVEKNAPPGGLSGKQFVERRMNKPASIIRWFALVLLVALALLPLSVWYLPAPPEPPPPPPAPRTTTVVAVGDILLGRLLGRQMAEAGDYTLPFRSIAPTLTAADIAFGNLEGPFCPRPPYPDRGMIFRVRPRAVEGLVQAGFDVLSVANNHFQNCGDAGIRFSLDHLRKHGIAAVGAGRNFQEAHTPAVLTRNGVRFAFLAYSYASRRDLPGATRPVIAGRNPALVRRDVAAARKQADVVLVSLHDGAEYIQRIATVTRRFARAAIDAGATAVFGHHPHVPQRVERYRGGWIFYSLGNFVFQQQTPGTRTGLLARLTFIGPALQRVEALPVVIETFSRPRLAAREEAAPVLGLVGLAQPRLWPVPPPAATAASGTD